MKLKYIITGRSFPFSSGAKESEAFIMFSYGMSRMFATYGATTAGNPWKLMTISRL